MSLFVTGYTTPTAASNALIPQFQFGGTLRPSDIVFNWSSNDR
jgi:hypothetical protein